MTLEELKAELSKPETFWETIYYTPFRLYHRFDELYGRVKCALQRAFRGYDDTVFWSLHDAITDIAIPALTYMIEHGHGYPLNSTEARWRKDLITMRDGFQALKDAQDYWHEDFKIYKRELKKFDRKFQKGIDLFAKNFKSLWD